MIFTRLIFSFAQSTIVTCLHLLRNKYTFISLAPQSCMMRILLIGLSPFFFTVPAVLKMAPRRHAYEASLKLIAIEYAVTHGNRAAAREFNVNESMVRKWRKQEDALRQVKKNKLSFRGHKARWPHLEERIEQWVIEQGSASRSISTVSIRL